MLIENVGFSQKSEVIKSPPRKPRKQKAESDEGKQDYFWGEEESMRFMIQMHRLGKSWVNISKALQGRSSLQCRTHGQKYLQSLEGLCLMIDNYFAGKEFFQEQHHFKIRRYEEECLKLIDAYQTRKYGDFPINWQLFPQFLWNCIGIKQAPAVRFDDKLVDIRDAILREINHYN